jgi:hypothetical protein
MKVLPTVKKIKEKIKTFEHVQVLMYHKTKVLMRMSSQHKTFTWSWNDAAASVLVSKKVVLENVILKIQLGKSSSMSKFHFKMRHQSRPSLVWFCCILNTMKRLFKTEWLLYPVEMRLKVKTESIIAVLSMVIVLIFNPKIALDFLESQKNIRRKP